MKRTYFWALLPFSLKPIRFLSCGVNETGNGALNHAKVRKEIESTKFLWQNDIDGAVFLTFFRKK